MTERHDVTRATTITPGRVTSRRAAVLAVTLIAVSTLLAGCLIVPFDYGYEHRRHRHHHGYRHW